MFFVIFTALIFKIACYLGFGALMYAVTVSTTFDPTSVLMWGYLLAWPLILLALILSMLGVIGVVCLVIFAFAVVFLGFYGKYCMWRKRKAYNKMMAALKSQR